MGSPKLGVGMTHAFEFALCFIAWAGDRDISAKDIVKRFGVHRATAYRWLRAWKDVKERELS